MTINDGQRHEINLVWSASSYPHLDELASATIKSEKTKIIDHHQ